MAKLTCSNCGNPFLGRAGSKYCSPACKQRAHRRNRNAQTVTVTVPAVEGSHFKRDPSSHSAEAVALLAALDAELADNSESLGLSVDEPLIWSAAESEVLEMVATCVDRRVDLWARYLGSDESRVRVKLSAELRLLEMNIARLLRSISTSLPAPPSAVTVKAQRAANTRWRKGTGA